jgi:hypothetical protein
VVLTCSRWLLRCHQLLSHFTQLLSRALPLQDAGELEFTDRGGARAWGSSTGRPAGGVLQLVAPSPTSRSISCIASGAAGTELLSRDAAAAFKLVVTAGGNPQLVDAASGRVLWSPNLKLPGAKQGYRLCLQPDGGLALRDNNSSKVQWRAVYEVPPRSQRPFSLVVDSGQLRVLDGGCGTLYNATGTGGAAGAKTPSLKKPALNKVPSKPAKAPSPKKVPSKPGKTPSPSSKPGGSGKPAPKQAPSTNKSGSKGSPLGFPPRKMQPPSTGSAVSASDALQPVPNKKLPGLGRPHPPAAAEVAPRLASRGAPPPKTSSQKKAASPPPEPLPKKSKTSPAPRPSDGCPAGSPPGSRAAFQICGGLTVRAPRRCCQRLPGCRMALGAQ